LGQPLSFYAATKQSNEAIAFTYARNHGMAITGLRFFTAYGPWGRPDMTPVLFAHAIAKGQPIRLYNHGKYRRDFTYIDDISRGVVKALLYPPTEVPNPPYRVFNLGHNQPVEMIRFVSVLEEALGRKAQVELLPPQPTEMDSTCADISRARSVFGYEPKVGLEQGVRHLVDWYLEYYGA
jgi:UDP-glucuronate 4-epimerase